MNKGFLKLQLLLWCCLAISCEPWNLEELDFLEVETLEVDQIGHTSARIGGKINNLQQSRIVRLGHCWTAENRPPTTDDQILLASTEADTFFSDLSNLKMRTIYRVRTFLELEGRPVFYGKERVFSTSGIFVLTDEPSRITSDTVSLVGSVIGVDVNVPIDEYGHIWSVSDQLDLDNFLGATNLGERLEEGLFFSDLTGLTPSTLYYAQAYAISNNQRFYGELVSFTIDDYWLNLAPYPGNTFYATGSALNNRGYLLADNGLAEHSTLQEYDFTLNEWTATPIEIIEEEFISNAISFVINDTVYFVKASTNLFGESYSFSLFNQNSGWLNSSRSFPNNNLEEILPLAAASAQERGFVIDCTETSNCTFWEYIPETGWISRKAPESNISDPRAFGIGNQIFLFPNFLSCRENLVARWSVYDIVLDKWEKREGLPFTCDPNTDERRLNIAAAFSINNKGYILLDRREDNLWEYDPLSDTWTPRADFKDETSGKISVFSYDDRAYLANTGAVDNFWTYISKK